MVTKNSNVFGESMLVCQDRLNCFAVGGRLADVHGDEVTLVYIPGDSDINVIVMSELNCRSVKVHTSRRLVADY